MNSNTRWRQPPLLGMRSNIIPANCSAQRDSIIRRSSTTVIWSLPEAKQRMKKATSRKTRSSAVQLSKLTERSYNCFVWKMSNNFWRRLDTVDRAGQWQGWLLTPQGRCLTGGAPIDAVGRSDCDSGPRTREPLSIRRSCVYDPADSRHYFRWKWLQGQDRWCKCIRCRRLCRSNRADIKEESFPPLVQSPVKSFFPNILQVPVRLEGK